MRVYETEEEQLEALALWWQQWRLPLGIGISALVLGILLYNSWSSWNADQHRQAYEMHETISEDLAAIQTDLEQLQAPPNETDTAAEPPAEITQQQLQQRLDGQLEQIGKLLTDWPYSGYAWLSVLNAVSLAQELDRRQAIGDLLGRAVDITATFWRGNALFNGLFRLHLARHMADGGRGDEALALLQSDSLAPYAALADDLRGDLLADKGDMEGAHQAWTRALAGAGNQFFASLVRVKLSSWSILAPATNSTNNAEAQSPTTAETGEMQ